MMQFKKPEKVCKVSSFATDDGPVGTGIKLSPCIKCGFCERRARIKAIAAKNRSLTPPHPILARIASKCDEAKAEIDLMPEPKTEIIEIEVNDETR